ncbi:phage portal protein [Clostridium paraputrificum]|uniref:phage portal protein n=1 Tax=Clostridium paraputrificum TaxID=29363 RepID=UPI000420209E|nr:phage portal protein [Clostridium paraputrificum]
MITFEQARELYEDFRLNKRPRLEKLNNYYNANHAILNKKTRDNGKEPTRAVNNYAKYISTITTGYFIGNPITYIYQEKDKLEEVEKIFKYNYESSHNAEIALDMSIYGVGYELNYLDETSQYCFASVDPRNVIVIDDGRIKPQITDAVIFDEKELKDNKIEVIMEVYDSTSRHTYKYIKDRNSATDFSFTLEKEELHRIGYCPIVEYRNNKNKKSDFEDIITLIDSYNDVTSSSIDDIKDFTDSILVIKNLSGATQEDIDSINENKVMLVDGDGAAEWLIKNINDTYNENVKNRLKHDIHKFSFTPDLTDEAFAGNVTGVAIKYKFQALEQLRQEKERWFNKGLIKRFIMINSYLSKYNKSIDLMELQIKFQANLPINTTELIQNVNNVTGIISHKTQLAMLPFIQDVDAELEQLEEEKTAANPYSLDDFKVDIPEQEENVDE